MRYDIFLNNVYAIVNAFANFLSPTSMCAHDMIGQPLLILVYWHLNENQIIKAAKSFKGKNAAGPDEVYC